MFSFLKELFGIGSYKGLQKTIMDSKLGKLVCEYKANDTYFTWDTEYKLSNNKGEPVSITIDGDLNGPFSSTLQKTYQIIDTITELSHDVQKQIDVQFPEKEISLTKNYSLSDVFVYINEETNKVDFEFEFITGDAEIMISVEYVNNEIDVIEFY